MITAAAVLAAYALWVNQRARRPRKTSMEVEA